MAEMNVDPAVLSVTHYPATATQATISSVAPVSAKNYAIVRSISACIVAGAAAESQKVTLRDGNGAGTILWSTSIAAPASGMGRIDLTDLNILVPTLGNQATLQFETAGAAGSQESVSLGYYNTDQLNDSRLLGRVF